uniref:O-acyltransferase n=1 Tax=Monopterus albus TaxID=43700 RepID=A0A3Q3JSG7_MONAL
GKIEVEQVISKKLQLKKKAEVSRSVIWVKKRLSLHVVLFESSNGKIELFEVNHLRTIYHIFVAVLFVFILNTLVVDSINEGRLVLDFDLLVYTFGQLPLVVCTWVCMFLSALVVPYTLFSLWSQTQSGSYSHPGLYSLVFGSVFLLYQALGLGFLPAYVVVTNSLPPASAAIVTHEQIRLMMKAHSFVRENVPRFLSWSKDKTSSVVPQVSQYLYFLFAPTLIYKDKYPRNPVIRWGYVASNFLQVLGCVFYLYYVLLRLCIPQFHGISQQMFDLKAVVLCVFNLILPGMLFLLLGFFSVIHCWFNAFAEMLRFADRMFYKDWWNSTSFANYYRTCNTVVHDWLYYYVYQDFLLMSRKRFKPAAMLLVFTMSAVAHEYILTLCLGFFYPVIFCLYMGIGIMFNFIIHDGRKGPIWNIILWMSLFLGQGISVCLYSHEWYAQRYCPLKEPSFLELLKPRSWSCQRGSLVDPDGL